LLLSAVLRPCAAAPMLLFAQRPPLSMIDISRPHGARQQTRRTPRLRSNDGTDTQTDGRTDERSTVCVDPAAHTDGADRHLELEVVEAERRA